MKVIIKRKCPDCNLVDKNKHEVKTVDQQIPPMLCWVCQTQGKQTMMIEVEREEEKVDE